MNPSSVVSAAFSVAASGGTGPGIATSSTPADGRA